MDKWDRNVLAKLKEDLIIKGCFKIKMHTLILSRQIIRMDMSEAGAEINK